MIDEPISSTARPSATAISSEDRSKRPTSDVTANSISSPCRRQASRRAPASLPAAPAAVRFATCSGLTGYSFTWNLAPRIRSIE